MLDVVLKFDNFGNPGVGGHEGQNLYNVVFEWFLQKTKKIIWKWQPCDKQ